MMERIMDVMHHYLRTQIAFVDSMQTQIQCISLAQIGMIVSDFSCSLSCAVTSSLVLPPA